MRKKLLATDIADTIVKKSPHYHKFISKAKKKKLLSLYFFLSYGTDVKHYHSHETKIIQNSIKGPLLTKEG